MKRIRDEKTGTRREKKKSQVLHFELLINWANLEGKKRAGKQFQRVKDLNFKKPYEGSDKKRRAKRCTSPK